MPVRWVLLWAAALAAGPSAFEIPLTRSQRAQKLVEEGQEQMFRGDYLRAIESCTRALQVRDDWAPAYSCRSEAKLRTRDPAAASDAWRALRLDPKSGEPHRLLGLLEYEAGRHQAAIEHFNQALGRSKLKPEAASDIYYYRARSLLSLGRLAEATRDMEHGIGILRGISGDYGDWSFYSLRAEIRRRRGEREKAEADERRVVELITQRIKRRPSEAALLLRRRAESYSALEEHAKAAEDYASAMRDGGEDARTLRALAQALSKLGRREQALGRLDRALELDPKDAASLRMRSLERIRAGDRAKAVADLDAYLELRPDDASALADRAVSRRLLEDYAGALSDVERAQKLDPAQGSALWGHKAFALEMLGRHEAVLEASALALEKDPEDASANIARARAGVALGRCREASAAIEWVVARSGDSSGYPLWLRGECRCIEKEHAACLADLERAAGLQPESRLIAGRLARLHRGYLTGLPERTTDAELRKSLGYYDRLGALGELQPSERMERTMTLYELGARLPGPEGLRLLREAAAECVRALDGDPKNRRARDLRRLIRRRLASAVKAVRK